MKITTILIVSTSIALFVNTTMAQGTAVQSSNAASAQVSTAAKPKNPKSVNAKQQRQEKRIEQGVASGELTNKEAAKLNARQGKIQREEARMRADGDLSAKERAKLQHDLKKSNKAIKKQKHDKQDKD
jgi:hypothetical protein